MESGKLRESITIYSAVHSKGSTGEAIDTWSAVVTTFAEVQPLEGREFFSEAKRVGEELARFVIRERDDLTTEMRIYLGSVIYGIREIRSSEGKNIIIGVRLSCVPGD